MFKPITAAILLGTAALAAPASAGHHAEKKSITAIASETDALSTLVTAVVAAELADTLATGGPYTVLAPTNAAFDALPAGTLDTLLADPGGDLTDILTYHVIAGEFKSGELIAAANRNGSALDVPTLNGGSLTIMVHNGKIMIEDANGNTVNVVKANVNASNGTVHVIDGVLLP